MLSKFCHPLRLTPHSQPETRHCYSCFKETEAQREAWSDQMMVRLQFPGSMAAQLQTPGLPLTVLASTRLCEEGKVHAAPNSLSCVKEMSAPWGRQPQNPGPACHRGCPACWEGGELEDVGGDDPRMWAYCTHSSVQENPMDRGVWQTAVHSVTSLPVTGVTEYALTAGAAPPGEGITLETTCDSLTAARHWPESTARHPKV